MNYDHLFHSDPHSLFLNYEAMKLGQGNGLPISKMNQPDFPMRHPTNNNKRKLFDSQIISDHRLKIGRSQRTLFTEHDFSDSNSLAASSHFKLYIPQRHYQKSQLDLQGQYQQASQYTMPTKTLLAPSEDFTELELKTLNNSEYFGFDQSIERRKTFNALPSMPRLGTPQQANFYNDRSSNYLGQLNTPEILRRSPWNHVQLNQSLPSHAAVNQSQKFFTPKKHKVRTSTNLFTGSGNQYTPDRIQNVHKKFGSMFVNNQNRPRTPQTPLGDSSSLYRAKLSTLKSSLFKAESNAQFFKPFSKLDSIKERQNDGQLNKQIPSENDEFLFGFNSIVKAKKPPQKSFSLFQFSPGPSCLKQNMFFGNLNSFEDLKSKEKFNQKSKLFNNGLSLLANEPKRSSLFDAPKEKLFQFSHQNDLFNLTKNDKQNILFKNLNEKKRTKEKLFDYGIKPKKQEKTKIEINPFFNATTTREMKKPGVFQPKIHSIFKNTQESHDPILNFKDKDDEVFSIKNGRKLSFKNNNTSNYNKKANQRKQQLKHSLLKVRKKANHHSHKTLENSDVESAMVTSIDSSFRRPFFARGKSNDNQPHESKQIWNISKNNQPHVSKQVWNNYNLINLFKVTPALGQKHSLVSSPASHLHSPLLHKKIIPKQYFNESTLSGNEENSKHGAFKKNPSNGFHGNTFFENSDRNLNPIVAQANQGIHNFNLSREIMNSFSIEGAGGYSPQLRNKLKNSQHGEYSNQAFVAKKKQEIFRLNHKSHFGKEGYHWNDQETTQTKGIFNNFGIGNEKQAENPNQRINRSVSKNGILKSAWDSDLPLNVRRENTINGQKKKKNRRKKRRVRKRP